MQYTYKDECLISDKSDLHAIIAVLVFACIDVILFSRRLGITFGKTAASSFFWTL